MSKRTSAYSIHLEVCQNMGASIANLAEGALEVLEDEENAVAMALFASDQANRTLDNVVQSTVVTMLNIQNMIAVANAPEGSPFSATQRKAAAAYAVKSMGLPTLDDGHE